MRVPFKLGGFSKKDHKQVPQNPDIYYRVPYVNQVHGNLCADATATMLLRWANRGNLANNLAIQRKHWENECEFRDALKDFRKLAEDKLRDRAIGIFERFLTPNAPRSIVASSNLQATQELTQLANTIQTCRNVKAQRDQKYGGDAGFFGNLINRWDRHTTKTQGFVAGIVSAFDPIEKLVTHHWANSDVKGGMYENPRGLFDGLGWRAVKELFPNQFKDDEPPRIGDNRYDYSAALSVYGPLMIVVSFGTEIFGRKVSHWVLVTGIKDDTLLYHDSWRGANMSMSITAFNSLVERGPDKRMLYLQDPPAPDSRR